MQQLKTTSLTIVMLFPLLLYACASLNNGYDMPGQHPPEAELGKRKPICTECHDPVGEHVVFKRFNHTPYFAANHRHEASQNRQVCNLCHKANFCNDCHAVGIELKPSIKNQTENYRRLPHRGDYLTRHRIDARIDPTSCSRCHGNPKTSRTCVRCHG